MAASHTMGAEVRSFSRRLLGALRLDAWVYREVEADQGALAQAAVVVLHGGLARGIGAVGEEGLVGLVGGPLIGLLRRHHRSAFVLRQRVRLRFQFLRRGCGQYL